MKMSDGDSQEKPPCRQQPLKTRYFAECQVNTLAGGRQSKRARGDGFCDEEQLIGRCCSTRPTRLTSRGTTRRGRTKADAHSIEVTRLDSLWSCCTCSCVEMHTGRRRGSRCFAAIDRRSVKSLIAL